MKRTFYTIGLCTAIIFGSCCNKATDTQWLSSAIETSAYQLKQTAEKYGNQDLIPRTYVNDSMVLVGPNDWTSGFFPGSLWLAYELTGDQTLKTDAEKFTAKLEQVQYNKGTHDLGFMMFCSYGNQHLITKDTVSVPILVQSAESLASRYRDSVGLIRSWDFGAWNYPVIIDNMMNLELLFWASKQTGDPKFKNISISHADNTIANHFRPDFSSYHVVSYNNDGTVESRGTYQGLADSSAWARGQSWGLYGYTVCYRETGLERFLAQAENIAGFIMNNPATPEDLIPYWDYNDPKIPNALRDASAGAVITSALLELSTLTKGEKSKQYFDYAEKMLKSLSSDTYLAAKGTNGGFIIKHCLGHMPHMIEIDTPLNYADYYYLEALKRYIAIKGLDPRKL